MENKLGLTGPGRPVSFFEKVLAIVKTILHVVIGICVYAGKKFAEWFKKRTVKQQRVIAVAGVVVVLATLFGLSFMFRGSKTVTNVNAANSIPYPDLVPVPLGASRSDSTAEQLAWRVDKIIDTRTFWIMREGEAVKGAERINQKDYQDYIDEAAKFYGVNRSIIEAIHYLESFGDEKAKSPTGPKGPGQFTVRTAHNIGVIDGGQCLVVFEGVECGKPLPKTLPKVVKDNREDIRLSVFATAKLISDEIKFFGDEKFAIMAYHSSRDSVRNWVKKMLEPNETGLGGKADIEKYKLTYEKLYFGSTPYKNPGTYKMYRDLMDVDWGPNYPWKVLDSVRLLQKFRDDPKAYEKLAEDNKFRGKRAKYRMWTFYDDSRDEADTLQTLEDLKKKVSDGTLVTIPQDPDRLGYKLRLEGSGVIAELDKSNQQYYLATKEETAGAALFIAQGVKNLRAANNATAFLLDITSVSRTVSYQQKLTKKNSTATKELSFHVLAAAFDIAKSSLTPDQDRDLRFILDELDSTGMISWVPEKKAYHVVVAPNEKAIEFFKRYFRDNKGFQTSSPLVTSGGDWQ